MLALAAHVHLRYHHDGKHNVMATAGPVQVYGQLIRSHCPIAMSD